MSGRFVIALPGNETFAARLAAALDVPQSPLHWRRFPDHESYLRLDPEVAGAEVIMVCTLADPDPRLLRLLFAARTARDLGARRVILVAPYLAYMRQDMRFHPGEALTSVCFADLISEAFDALITVDPHLHRYHSLGDLYPIETHVVHAAPVLARWISAHVREPLIVGPDEESRQWAAQVAAGARAPVVIMDKSRAGDRQVRVVAPDLSRHRGRTPVLVDDIVSSGQTMVETVEQLALAGFGKPVCVVVHPLFAGHAYDRLRGVTARIVSTDTVAHDSNGISVVDAMAERLTFQED